MMPEIRILSRESREAVDRGGQADFFSHAATNHRGRNHRSHHHYEKFREPLRQ